MNRRALLAATLCLSLVNCAYLKKRNPLSGQVNLNLNPADALKTQLSPNTQQMLALAGPVAVEALAHIAAALQQRAEERRALEERQEEARRIEVASAQIFYAEACTQKSSEAAAGNGPQSSQEKDADQAFAKADYAHAATSLQAAREAAEKQGGQTSAEVARLLNKEAAIQLALGDYPSAIAPAARALKIRQDAYDAVTSKTGERDAARVRPTADLAESDTTMGQIYRAAGVHKEAGERLSRAYDLRKQQLGDDHVCVAQSANALGELKLVQGEYVKARGYLESAAKIREARLPADHRDLAQSWDNLGSLDRSIGAWARAQSYYERALANRMKLGADHPDVAESHHSLATLHKAKGDFASAESEYLLALDIRTRKLGEGLEVARTRDALAELYLVMGDLDAADAQLSRALAVRRQKLPADHPDLADSVANAARLALARGDLPGARRSFEEARGIRERKYGPKHPSVARTQLALAEVATIEGRYDDADQLLQTAQASLTASLGAEHPDVAEAIHLAGVARKARGDFAGAETLLTKAVELRKKALGAEHPDVAVSLSHLGAVEVALGKDERALATFTAAQTLFEDLVRSVGVSSTESRLDALLRFLRLQEEVVDSLLDDPKIGPKAARLALAVTLLRKGRAVDEAAGHSQALYAHATPEDRALIDERNALRSEVARKRLAPDANSGTSLTAAKQRLDEVERQLASRSAAWRARSTAPALGEIVASVARTLSKDARLVEVIAYHPYAFKAAGKQSSWGKVRYAALVLDGNGGVNRAVLGDRTAVDASVKAFLKAVAEPRGASAQEREAEAFAAGQALYKVTLGPLQPFAGDAKRLVLSLEGQLNLVPFWAVWDGKQYLIDRFEIAYVTSGRDLLRSSEEGPSGEVALFAKPTFMKGGAGSTLASDETRGLELVIDPPAKADASLGKKADTESSAIKLKAAPSPLAGTEQEAKAIKRIFPKATLLTGAEATKPALLGVESPSVLHVATHGLFRPEGRSEKTDRGLELTSGGLAAFSAARTRDPLLSSMLLMANASKPVGVGQPGVVLDPAGLVTALEMAGMNLWGTKLVVLSACETGRGDVDDLGAGVYGLRRAVVVAGAQTLVTSLWKVDDQVTRDLMSAYYRNLLGGMGRIEGLRQAALAVRKKNPEPRLWAPFVAIGQETPLKEARR